MSLALSAYAQNTSARIGNWMLTRNGVAYYPLDPRADEVFITDIAHALSMQCRYGGHCKRFYSVAEHSVNVSHLVPPQHALSGLMHDAAEAYCVDVPRPLKGHLKEYAEIEERNWVAIAEAFGLPWKIPECVHYADATICTTEMIELLPPHNWVPTVGGPQIPIYGYPPETARRLFLDRFDELMRRR